MTSNDTIMYKESCEFSSILKLHKQEKTQIDALVQMLKNNNISNFLTIGRGSSGNAALFAKYLIENLCLKPVFSFFPSVSTLYQSPVNFSSSIFFSVSQSGQSDDLIQSTHFAKKGNALTISLVNDVSSPLALASDHVVPLLAGPEKSVAATKSFLASLSRFLQITISWVENPKLQSFYQNFSQILEEPIYSRWENLGLEMKKFSKMFVLGRGYGYPIALEMALKLKETCGIFAEGLSGAEFMHGPISLLSDDLACLVILQKDETLPSQIKLCETLAQKKSTVFVIGTEDLFEPLKKFNFNFLPIRQVSYHSIFDLLLATQRFYAYVSHLALILGRNPDTPINLSKVTKTK